MKSYDVTCLIHVFATLNVSAKSEDEARAKVIARVSAGEFNVQDHTAELDTIESVTLAENQY